MKKNISLNLILFIVFLVGTILTMLIIFKDIDTMLSFIFIIGYVIYLVLYGLFSISLVIVHTRKLSWIQIRKRLFKFIFWFIFLSVEQCLIYYFFRPSGMGVWDLVIPFGVSFGLAFFDLIFWKKKD